MKKYKTIGIIGGQGPSSTADFYMRIVKYYQDNFAASYVRDYPPMIIYSVPTPDLVESVEDGELTFQLISNAVKKLEQDGADFIIIACNSLQYLNDKLQVLVKIPIMGIAPIVAEFVRNKGYNAVGILATDTTIKKKIYDPYLDKKAIRPLIPEQSDQKNVEEVIISELGGRTTIKETKKLKNIVEKLQKVGAEAILLACTELPLVIKQQDVNIPLIDCNELYAVEAAKLSSKV